MMARVSESYLPIDMLDQGASIKEMNKFVYTSNDIMLPIFSEEKATELNELYDVYIPYPVNSETLVENLYMIHDNASKGGIFGIEKNTGNMSCTNLMKNKRMKDYHILILLTL